MNLENLIESKQVPLEENVLSEHWEAPKKSDYYQGHFPGHPMLPGAVVIKKSLQMVSKFYPNFKFNELHSAKFKAEIKPAQKINIIVKKAALSYHVDWNCLETGNLICQIRFGL